MVEGETVLVTGGCGFIGSHTARKLLSDGYRVVVVDEMNDYYDPDIKHANLRDLRDLSRRVTMDAAAAHASTSSSPPTAPAWSEWERFKYYKCDIGDLAALKHVFDKERPSLVCHLAARAGVRYSIEDPLVYAHSNVVGTTNVLELSHQYKVRSVAMASSSSVYGDRPSDDQKGSWASIHDQGSDAEVQGGAIEEDESPGAFRETDTVTKPASPYAATKRACELLAYTYTKLHGLPIASLRFFTVYGPGGRPDMAPFKFIKRIYNGVPIDRYGDGSAVRDFTYVTDIVDGIVLSLLKPQGYQIYNLGGGRPISLAHFISLCEAAVGKKAIINELPTQPGDVARTHASILKAKRMLGFRAVVEVADGLKRTADWYIDFQKKKDLEATRDTVTEQPTRESMERAEALAGDAAPMDLLHRAPGVLSTGTSSSSGKDVDSGVCSDASDCNSVTNAGATATSVAVCTRIHGMRTLGPKRTQQLRSFVHAAAAMDLAAQAVIAVEVQPRDRAHGYDLFDEVSNIVQESDAVVLPVAQWGITTALNACVHYASAESATHVAFASLEVALSGPVVAALMRECCLDDTLVAGAALPGHHFQQSMDGASEVEGDGVTVPWNTLAVWNTARLSAIGFVAIGNGSKLLGAGAGIEEVSTISVIQQLRHTHNDARAKLVRVQGGAAASAWDTDFGGDAARQAKHEAKMSSKLTRARDHLTTLGLDAPPVISHHTISV